MVYKIKTSATTELIFNPIQPEIFPPVFLHKAALLINKNKEPEFTLEAIPEDDPTTLQEIWSGNTEDMFLLDTDTIRGCAVKLKPTSTKEINEVLALTCPGVLYGGGADDYIDRKHSRKFIKYFGKENRRELIRYYKRMHGKNRVECLPQDFEPILAETYGVILYRRQVIDIFRCIAKYSDEELNDLRITLEQCDPGGIADHRKRFVSGVKQAGIVGAAGEALFAKLSRFSRYDFFDAWQAAEYGRLAYYSAYMKTHYPDEYYAALGKSLPQIIQPFAQYSEKARHLATETTASLAYLAHGVEIKIAGMLCSLKLINTKKNETVAFAALEDLDGSVELLFYPEVYKTAIDFLHVESLVLITGTANVGEASTMIIVSDISPLPTS